MANTYLYKVYYECTLDSFQNWIFCPCIQSDIIQNLTIANCESCQLALVFGLAESQIILSQAPHVLGQALVGFVLNR